ncbi:MAG: prolipoprotein diacylglyceryl transferase, partial [Flavobacteriaceae bacterium]|nr:prolipoprotein diacylglyceryl transferase [Flavobacteriaceae bacterium]
MHILGIIWNPNETLFNLGGLQIKYYNLLWIIAFALGWYLMKKIFLSEKKTLEQLDSLFIHAVLSTMLGARLGHVFFYDWAYYQDHLLEILLPIRESSKGALFGLIRGYEFTGFAGLASHGAAIGIILGMMLYIKKNPEFKLLSLFDRLVVPVSLGAFCIRLGNFFNSEINGKIVSGDFIFATKFIRDSEDMSAYKAMGITGERTPEAAYAMIETNPDFAAYLEAIPFRHPAQLYEGIAYLAIFILLYYIFWNTAKKDKVGYLFGLFFILL